MTMNKVLEIIKTTLPFGLATAMLVGCGSDTSPDQAEQEIIAVKVAKVETLDSGYFNAGSGQITATKSATLSTRMMGFVQRIPVKVGQKVTKGQLLVAIKNVDLQAKKAQAEASILEAKAGFQNAEKDYQRFVNLFNQNSASQKELDDMTSRFEMAKARYEAAQQMMNEVDAQFAYANIRAPFSGMIINTHVDEGTMANPGKPLVSIEAPGAFEVEARVAENQINQLKVGTEANVLVKALDASIKGKLTELSSSAQFSGGQYFAKVLLDNPPEEVRSGMFATVSFAASSAGQESATISIPKTVLVEKGQLNGIYTIGPNNTAILRWLRLGNVIGDEVEVLSGLAIGETYIVSSEGKLFNGAKVAIQ